MNVLSLFDGISCGRVALERAGIKVSNYYASEVDKYAIKTSAKNWPNIVQLGGVEQVTAQSLPRIDLLLGGSPCQGFSNAGKRLNFDDPRSKLFFEYVRILKELKAVNPDIKFLLENVRMKKEWLDIISEQVGVEPIMVNSALVSAQNRKRYYWTNIEGVTQPQDKGLLLKDILETSVDMEDCVVLSDKAIARAERRNYSKPKVLPDKTGTINTVNNAGKLCFDSGTTLVPIQGAAIRNQVTPRGVEEQLNVRTDGKSNCVVASYPNRLNGVYLTDTEVSRALEKYSGKTWNSGNRMGNMKFPDDINKKSRCITASCIKGARETMHIEDGIGFRTLTPLECERLQTLPDNYTEGVSNRQRYKQIGNGWTVDVIAHILKNLK